MNSNQVRTVSFDLKKIVIRLLLLTVGSAFMGVGTQLAVKSGFGADTVALFWEGLTLKFNITLAAANLYFSIILLLFVVVLDRKMIGVGTIISPLVQSYTMQLLETVSFHTSTVIINVMVMILGIVIISIGCDLYSNAELGCSPYIGIIQAITHKTGITVGWIKTIADGSCLLGALALGKMPAIGAVFSVLISGYVMDKSERFIKRYQMYYL